MAYKEELRNQDTELEFETGNRISHIFLFFILFLETLEDIKDILKCR